MHVTTYTDHWTVYDTAVANYFFKRLSRCAMNRASAVENETLHCNAITVLSLCTAHNAVHSVLITRPRNLLQTFSTPRNAVVSGQATQAIA